MFAYKDTTAMQPTMLCYCVMFLRAAAVDGTDIQEWTFKKNQKPSNFSLSVLHGHPGISRIQCIVECSQSKGCFTLEYKRSGSICTKYRLFRNEDGKAALTTSAPDAHSFTMNDPRGQHHGETCSCHVDCVDDRTQCRDNVCKCLAGYSLNPKDGSCIKGPKRLHLGETCSSNAECVDDGTRCADNLCKCMTGYSMKHGDPPCTKDPKRLHLGETCSSDAECVDDGTRCADNVCHCMTGYSLKHGDTACTKDPKRMHLGEKCSSDAECVDDGTRCADNLCHCMTGYSQKHGDPPCTKDPKRRYGETCSRPSDCVGDRTQCIDRKCRCQAGYSFFPRDRSCVEECDKYGRTFSLLSYENCSHGFNDETYHVSDSGRCSEKCRQCRSFTCRSFELWHRACYLSKDTRLAVPDKDWQAFRGCRHYQRNCA